MRKAVEGPFFFVVPFPVSPLVPTNNLTLPVKAITVEGMVPVPPPRSCFLVLLPLGRLVGKGLLQVQNGNPGSPSTTGM